MISAPCSGLNTLAESLSIMVVAAGVETRDKARGLFDTGIHLMQGYFFAKPEFESLPPVTPDIADPITARPWPSGYFSLGVECYR